MNKNNQKVSAGELCMFISLAMTSTFLGLIDNILFNTTKNDSFIAIFIGSILGLIFIFIFLKIFSFHEEANIYEKTKILFKKTYNIFNFLIFLYAILTLIIGIRSLLIFIKSRYLFETPYFVTGLFIVITIILISKNGFENFSRLFQIFGVLSIGIIIIIEAFLSKYIEIENLLPIFTSSSKTIIYGSLFYAFSTSFLIFLFLAAKKSMISDKEKFNKKIIIYYVINSIFMLSIMLFVLGCYGYKFSSIFRYPEYMALKKVTIGNTEQHTENLFAFHWTLYMLSLCVISYYAISEYLKSITKNAKKQKVLPVLIILLALLISKNIFGEIVQSVLLMKNIYIIVLCLPFLIVILIIFIKCLLKKDAP